MQRESLNTREQSREDKGEDGERKNVTASIECQREKRGQLMHLFLTETDLDSVLTEINISKKIHK